MSDLVEKVAKAMCLSCGVDPEFVSDGKVMWHRFLPDARATIKALAEWLDDNADEQYVSSADLLRKTLKEPPHE